MRDAVVRIQATDGSWEHIGGDRASGITAQGLQLSSDAYGPATASFELHRDPGAAWPDLAAFTPIEIQIANRVIWTGRISETQLRDGAEKVISVAAEGAQAALDDDQFAKLYVNRKLDDWKPLADVVPVGTDWTGHGGTVEIGSGSSWLGWREGSQPKANQLCAMVLDLGGTSSYNGLSIYASMKNFLEYAKQPLAGTSTTTANTGYLQNFGPSVGVPYLARATALSTWTAGTNALGDIRATSSTGQVVTSLTAGNTYNPNSYLKYWKPRQNYSVGDYVVYSPARTVPSSGGDPAVTVPWFSDQVYLCTSAVTGANTLAAPPTSGLWQAQAQVSGQNYPAWGQFEFPIYAYAGFSPDAASLATLGQMTGATFTSTYDRIYGGNIGYGGGAGSLANTGGVLGASDGTSTVKDPKNVQRGAFYGVTSPAAGAVNARYVWIVLAMQAYAQTSLRNAYGMNFDAISVYGDDSYATSGFQANYTTKQLAAYTTAQKSSLTADEVVADALQAGAPSLTASTPAPPTTKLQHLNTGGYKTPREVISAANSYHGWITRVDENNSLTFKPLPTVPLFQLDAASGYEFTDQAATNSSEVYSRVVVDGTLESGAPGRVVRGASQLASSIQLSTAGASTLSSDQTASIRIVDRDSDLYFPFASTKSGSPKFYLANGSVVRAGVTYVITGTCDLSAIVPEWTATSYDGTSTPVLVRYPSGSTTVYRADQVVIATDVPGTSPKWTLVSPFQYLSFTVGRTDTVDGQVYLSAAAQGTANISVSNPSGAGNSATLYLDPSSTNIISWRILYTPDQDAEWGSAKPFVTITEKNDYQAFFDPTIITTIGTQGFYNGRQNLKVQTRAATFADLRGIRRTYQLSVPGIQTTGTLASIGDAWLYERVRARYKGTVTTSGPSSLKQYSSGDPVHPSRLLLAAGELLHLADRIDPNTGQLGRDARIASVTYSHDDESVNVSLDNTRENLQIFLNRLSDQY